METALYFFPLLDAALIQALIISCPKPGFQTSILKSAYFPQSLYGNSIHKQKTALPGPG